MTTELSADTKLSHYRIVSKIGAGGMGEVYLAEDTRLHRKVALKILPAELTDHQDRLKRFEQEAQAASALNHPNILTIHEFGAANDLHFIVMEFVDGVTLREKLSSGRMSISESVDVAVQTASALFAAHEAGIIHRDIKPENVMLRPDGLVKVLDFGLAKLSEHRKDIHAADYEAPTLPLVKTNPGAVMGTTSYMSPEQTRGAEVDSRTDIFSLGVVLYEMLTGQKPFTGDSAIEVLSAILKEEPPELGEADAKISPALQRVVRKCLEKKPERRFHSAHDLGFALEAVSTGSGSRPDAGAGFPVSALLKRAKTANREWLAWLLALGFAALAVVALLYAWQLRSSQPKQRAFRQLSFRREAIFQAGFAPDGKTVVYSAATEGNTPEIFTVHPDFPAPQPLGVRGMHLLDVSSNGELAILMDAKYIGSSTFKRGWGGIGHGCHGCDG